MHGMSTSMLTKYAAEKAAPNVRCQAMTQKKCPVELALCSESTGTSSGTGMEGMGQESSTDSGPDNDRGSNNRKKSMEVRELGGDGVGCRSRDDCREVEELR